MSHFTVRWRRRWTGALAALAMLAACTPLTPAPAPEPGIPKDGAPLEPYRYVYRCEGDFRFAVRVGPGAATLDLDNRELVLPQQVAASGTRYAAGGVTFWSKGLLALLETPERSYRDCVGQPAWTSEAATSMLRPGTEAGVPLAGTDWRLFELNGAPALTPETGRGPALRFDAEEERLSGFTGCNLMSGRYTQEGERLTIAMELVTTKMACIDPALNRQEMDVLRTLPRVTRAVVWGQTLTLYAGAEPVARFTVGN